MSIQRYYATQRRAARHGAAFGIDATGTFTTRGQGWTLHSDDLLTANADMNRKFRAKQVERMPPSSHHLNALFATTPMTAETEYFLPDPARYTEAAFIRRLIKHRLHQQPVENLIVGFYKAGKLISVRTTAKGDAHHVRLPLGRILSRARRIDATAIAIAHNHPDAPAAPSQADIVATRITFEACWRCGVELRDELILSINGIYSMRDFGPWPKALESYTAIRSRNLIFPD